MKTLLAHMSGGLALVAATQVMAQQSGQNTNLLGNINSNPHELTSSTLVISINKKTDSLFAAAPFVPPKIIYLPESKTSFNPDIQGSGREKINFYRRRIIILLSDTDRNNNNHAVRFEFGPEKRGGVYAGISFSIPLGK